MTDTELRTLLTDRLATVREQMATACRKTGRDPSSVTLVAVTKTVTPRVAAIVADLGITDLGENRPQELWKKADAVPGVRWHLIGHLQRNKIDRTVPLVTLIHSVDSERVLQALHAFGEKRGDPVPVLLEVNCSREENKGGFRPEDLPALGERLAGLTGVSIRGLMTMAAYFEDPQLCRPAFAELRERRDRLRTSTGLALPDLSMGMSNDYPIAIEEGATLVRVGTALFEGCDE